MRCPKCHYLSFEPEARCRNCGYDLALAEDDLIIKAVDDEDEGLMQDFDLHSEPRTASVVPITLGPLHAESSNRIESASVVVAPPAPPAPPAPRPVRPPSTTTELPLFMRASAAAEAADAEAPLVQVPASPRPPLAVRRRPDLAPEPVRLERTSMNDVAANLESVWAPLPPTPAPEIDDVRRKSAAADEIGESDRFGAGNENVAADFRGSWKARDAEGRDTTASPAQARVLAAAIDLLLLGGIDLVVVSLTLRICALTFGEVLTLPWLPLAAFFGLMAAGYLLLFTATTGQTLGKMATHIRVVDSADEAVPEPLSLRQAIVRSLAALPSVLALGVGFLPALGGEGLAVHDRIAHTRVVRA